LAFKGWLNTVRRASRTKKIGGHSRRAHQACCINNTVIAAHHGEGAVRVDEIHQAHIVTIKPTTQNE
jgi:hypothetical protein